jgi:hypothetical protein
MKQTDILTTNHGSIIKINADSAKGRRWMLRHIPDARASVTFGAYTWAEHRYGVDIICGAVAAGLRVRDAASGRLAAIPEGC